MTQNLSEQKACAYESFVMKLLIYYDSVDNNNINKMHSKKQHLPINSLFELTFFSSCRVSIDFEKGRGDLFRGSKGLINQNWQVCRD